MHEPEQSHEPVSRNIPSRAAGMMLRRWFLILAAPVVLLLTIYAVLMWRQLWRMLMG